MAKDVCYRVEDFGSSIVLTQIWPNNMHYIKMSKSAACWILAQLDAILNAKERAEKVLQKKFECEISRAKKDADKIFGGKNETKH